MIKLNPLQSKHLETAAMLISGHSVDFVNLRTEAYTSDSRIPTSVVRPPPPMNVCLFITYQQQLCYDNNAVFAHMVIGIGHSNGRRTAARFHDQFAVLQHKRETNRGLHRHGTNGGFFFPKTQSGPANETERKGSANSGPCVANIPSNYLTQTHKGLG